jgi:formiminotetrahydrofolate cyclodeaminase
MIQLVTLTVEELFQKFGAGSHKPGSGSAAAMQGMLSAQLIRTVIDRTLDKQDYKQWHSELSDIDSEIDKRIFPALVNLFQADSEQFDKHMQLRNAKIAETNPTRKKQLAIQALQELKPATELPLTIASLCLELAHFSTFIFDNAFKSVRGDSGVALNSAVAAIGGCLAIVDLNLLSFTTDNWTTEIRKQSDSLRTSFVNLSYVSQNRLEALKKEVDFREAYHLQMKQFVSGSWHKSKLLYSDIEEIANSLLNTLWIYRTIIWKKNVPKNPLDILLPEKALCELGYQFNVLHALGQFTSKGRKFEIAGIIDKQQKVVAISSQFTPTTQNFTAAHELGHALLHEQQILHRDRPLDGSTVSDPRNNSELEADKFAAFFLMPQKQVRSFFYELFAVDKFILNEHTAVALGKGRVSDLRKKLKNQRDLSKLIASTTFFNGRKFKSLSDIFHVSVETMAIRLEELQLVEY